MTDKELLQRWIKPYAIVPVTMDATRILVDGLRETLAHPKKEWVGLTDSEREEAVWESGKDGLTSNRYDVALAVETKLKEKNT
jgi:hypothetical protein